MHRNHTSHRLLISGYHFSLIKRLLDLTLSLFIVLVSLPLSILISILIKLGSKGDIFYLQTRLGKRASPFRIVKFRTMKTGAEAIQNKYRKFNESDGPVFKIKNDPRFTKFGKFLSRTGLDELPQFINVLKGDMSIVGPRPLPVKEALKLKTEYKNRELIKPGITSLWVVNGSHKLKFKKWMELDNYYLENANFCMDISIMCKTFSMIVHSLMSTKD